MFIFKFHKFRELRLRSVNCFGEIFCARHIVSGDVEVHLILPRRDLSPPFVGRHDVAGAVLVAADNAAREFCSASAAACADSVAWVSAAILAFTSATRAFKS